MKAIIINDEITLESGLAVTSSYATIDNNPIILNKYVLDLSETIKIENYKCAGTVDYYASQSAFTGKKPHINRLSIVSDIPGNSPGYQIITFASIASQDVDTGVGARFTITVTGVTYNVDFTGVVKTEAILAAIKAAVGADLDIVTISSDVYFVTTAIGSGNTISISEASTLLDLLPTHTLNSPVDGTDSAIDGDLYARLYTKLKSLYTSTTNVE